MVDNYIQANTQGRLHPATEPSLSPLNRGFLYGDAVYEVWRTYGGTIFAFDEHWERLVRSAASLHFRIPWTREEMLAEIRRTAAAFFEHQQVRSELYIRLQVARGAGQIGLDVGLADQAVFVLLVQRISELSPEKLLKGFRLSQATSLFRNAPRTLNPAWKTGNYLNNILCLREAIARGADEVVMVNLQGEVTEAAVSNLFFVREGTVITPPLSAGILEGITRALILDPVAPAAGIAVREEVLRPEDLASFQECFLTSTTKEIVPVGSIDACTYRTGPGPVTGRLREAFAGYVRRYCSEREDLRI